jgi:septum formation protein
VNNHRTRLQDGTWTVRFILASASPARLRTLRGAGWDPEVIVSGVDEDAFTGLTVTALVQSLADAKAAAVVSELSDEMSADAVVLGCDSLLEFDGEPLGKPDSAAEAVDRWRRMRGQSGILHTGHRLTRVEAGVTTTSTGATASTTVHFGSPSDAEIDRYVATGEPLAVAGAFTLDGFGGWFIEGVEGDHHNVVGVSLPLVRRLLAELSVSVTEFWR